MISYVYVERGMYDEALAANLEWQKGGDNPWRLPMLAYIYGRSGQQTKAQQVLKKILVEDQRHKIDPLALACAYIGTKDKEKAISEIEEAYREHSAGLSALKVDPIYNSLRGEAQFQQILNRMGFPP